MVPPNSSSILAAALQARTELDSLISILETTGAPPADAAPLLAATDTLSQLLVPPFDTALSLVFSQYSFAALSALIKHRVFHHLPATTATLSTATEIPPQTLHRLLMLVSTHSLVAFTPATGVWTATPLTTPYTDPAQSPILTILTGMWGHVSAHLGIHAKTAESTSLFESVYGTPLYPHLAANPDEAAVFAAGMEGFGATDGSVALLAAWLRAANREGTFIDVGGANGYICAALAKALPPSSGVAFLVQDVAASRFAAADTAGGRIAHEVHDFFTPQPVRTDALAWLLRRCLHNWPDADAARVIRGFVPALLARRDAALLINETVLPAFGERWGGTRRDERRMRELDLCMLVQVRAGERDETQWRRVVEMADERLEVRRILLEEGDGRTRMGVLEVRVREGVAEGVEA
ncbi:O-methyltransferase-domain-containing protein [Geopyxis carbonaria]|nr:O-methyltransferase-domain-containing protein [Geopyxis carbonaria]